MVSVITTKTPIYKVDFLNKSRIKMQLLNVDFLYISTTESAEL